jgi:hypothetical protein
MVWLDIVFRRNIWNKDEEGKRLLKEEGYVLKETWISSERFLMREEKRLKHGERLQKHGKKRLTPGERLQKHAEL